MIERYDLRKNGDRIATMKGCNPRQVSERWQEERILEDFYLTHVGAYWDDADGNHFEVIPEHLW